MKFKDIPPGILYSAKDLEMVFCRVESAYLIGSWVVEIGTGKLYHIADLFELGNGGQIIREDFFEVNL